MQRFSFSCKFCKNETEHIDLLSSRAYCDESCYHSHKKYRDWKSLSTKRVIKNEEEQESFHDIIMRTGGYPVHCAHRGGGFEFAPENTMYAFRKSVAYGARILELDLRLTKDQHLVIMHWSTIDETTDGTGAVSDYTLEELRRFDAAVQHEQLRNTGITVPTLKEFLDEFVPVKDLLFFFDFKDVLSMRMTMKFIEPYNIGNRFILGSVVRTTNNLLLEIRAAQKVPVCTDILQTFEITLGHWFGLLNHYTFEHDIYGYVLCGATSLFWTQSLVETLHNYGRRVILSGYGEELNKVERLEEAISFGVDFIMTDRPDLLQPLLLGKRSQSIV